MVAPPPRLHPETHGLSLMLAVITSSNALLVLMDGGLKVIAASASFCRDFQIEPASVPGKRLSALGHGEWDVAQLTSLLEGTASGLAEVHAYEFDLKRDGQASRLLVMNAHKLDYDDKERIRVLLAVADVTDARASDKQKDNLLREKAILLQEVQHRVANSLQIIASILMQSARKVQSEETRGHLHDAHSRLMSIAAVQKHLAASRLGEVELRPYLVQLCKSLGASMVHDPKVLSIEVVVDESVTHAESLREPGVDRDGVGDQRPQTRVPATSLRENRRGVCISRAELDTVGERQRDRDAARPSE